MANSYLYWYPEDDGPLVRTDLGRCVSDLQPRQEHVVQHGESADLSPSSIHYGSRQALRIIVERVGLPANADLYRELEAFQDHVKRNKPFAFSLDHGKSWAGFPIGYTIEQGRDEIVSGGNVTGVFSPAAALAVDDYVTIESPNPGRRLERQRLSFVGSTGRLRFVDETLFNYVTGPVLVRWEYFFPILYVNPAFAGEDILTSDRDISFTLSIPAVTAPGAYAALYSESGGVGFTGVNEVGGLSLQNAIQQVDFRDVWTATGTATTSPLTDLTAASVKF